MYKIMNIELNIIRSLNFNSFAKAWTYKQNNLKCPKDYKVIKVGG